MATSRLVSMIPFLTSNSDLHGMESILRHQHLYPTIIQWFNFIQQFGIKTTRLHKIQLADSPHWSVLEKKLSIWKKNWKELILWFINRWLIGFISNYETFFLCNIFSFFLKTFFLTVDSTRTSLEWPADSIIKR